MTYINIGIVFITLMISGCTAQLQNIRSLSGNKANSEHSIVFGGLKTPKEWLKTAYVLKIKNITTFQEFNYSMRNWGCSKKTACNVQSFCLSLPPGWYRIERLDIYQGATITNTYPKINFKVAPATTVYIGTLSIGKATIERDYILWSNGKINLQILDEKDIQQDELAGTCPGVKDMDYESSLMIINQD